jgi:V-type H+-transporting ATPase subunit C
MSLSDDLVKTDMSIENVCRKIERVFAELSDDPNKKPQISTTGESVERYLKNFSWDRAKYPNTTSLPDLVDTITKAIAREEDELKQKTADYTEITQALGSIERKKGGSLMMRDLAEVITAENLGMSPSEIQSDNFFPNTEYLTTLVVVVPKNIEKDFLDTYQGLCADLVETTDGPTMSPVVPDSAVKLLEQDDSAVYKVTVLRGKYQSGFYDDEDGTFHEGTHTDYVEQFMKEAREHRFVARRFAFDPNAQAANKRSATELKTRLDRAQVDFERWCGIHFGEVFTAWMHVKAIRSFVESVLRYGLPVNFTTLLVQPKKGRTEKIVKGLDSLYAYLDEDGGADDDEGEFHPFYFDSFDALSE